MLSRIAVCLLLLTSLFAIENTWVEINGSMTSSNQIIIKFNEDVSPLLGQEQPLTFESRTELVEMLKDTPVLEFKPVFQNYESFTDLHRSNNLHQYYVISFTKAVDIESIHNQMKSLQNVETVDYNYQVRPAFVPNDPSYPEQWAHDNQSQAGPGNVGDIDCDMDTDEAWDITQGSEDVIVAVLDTGVNDHTELQGRLLDGYNFYDNNFNVSDVFGHGTQCSGIVAAAGNNSVGVAGVAWNSKILPVKVLGNGGNGDQIILANGIQWASDNGADVISMSLRWTNQVSLCDDAITYAFENGTLSLAATGNENISVLGYPSAYENCVAVGGLSPCNERKSYSSCDGESFWGANYGGDMDLVAPCVKIPTITNSGGYTMEFNGTSSACPNAAGVAALVKSVHPGLTPGEIRTILQETSVDILGPGWDAETGHGRINALNAVEAAVSMNCGNNTILGDTNLDGDVNVLDIVIVANIIIGLLEEPDYCQTWAANVNDDEIINILDIILIINTIMGY